MTATQELIQPDTQTTTGRPDVAHYALKSDIERSLLYGDLIEALCGERFRVTRDHANLPVCQGCANVYADNEAMGSESITEAVHGSTA
jgi:hypothetical protein